MSLGKNTNAYNQDLFRNSKLWNNYDISNEIKKKVQIVKQFIAPDVQSIIDIGCGNGIITNELSNDYNITGVDFSYEALHFVQCKKIQCSSDKMAIHGHSFDMVFSSELIEHLPLEMLKETISEFKRIAQKYIFITVPNNENLPKNYIKCPKCMDIFHSYGHLNSFTAQALTDIVGRDFVPVKMGYYGAIVRDYNKTLLRIRHKVANKWFQPSENTICPHCGNRTFESQKGNVISKFCNGLNNIISSQRPYWLFVLFKKA